MRLVALFPGSCLLTPLVRPAQPLQCPEGSLLIPILLVRAGVVF